MSNLNPQQFGYQNAEDRAPVDGVPLHQAKDQFHGLDENPHWWGDTSTSGTQQALAALRAHHNKPGEVEIYRGVPKEHEHINTGDWVTTSRDYAYNKPGNHVLAARVPTEHVRSTGDDIHEFGYSGPPIRGTTN